MTTTLKRKLPAPSEARVLASLSRKSFYDFVREFWSQVVPDKPVWNWHIKYLCRIMQRAAERVFRGEKRAWDLVVNISPGTTKSLVCSVMFPAWVWTRMPHARFICCSYSERLALKLSLKCRDLVRSELYKRCFPGLDMRPDQDTKGFFANVQGGERYAVGSNGSVLGNHAHFIIIDDPLDPEEAASDLELERTNRWIDEQLKSRKVDKMVTFTALIMQRLHQDDPAAQMVARKGVKHVRIPATDEFPVKPASLKQYYKGGLMDPVRLPREVLDDVRFGERGPYIYAGQYGQEPVPPGGGLFKTDMLKKGSPPRFRKIVRFWDKAGTGSGKSKIRAAYTVGVKMGIATDGRVFVLDVIRKRLDSFEREKMIRNVARLDGKHVEVGIEEEPGSGGKESAENTVRRLVGYVVRVLKVNTNKEARADAFSVQVNMGNVYLVPGEWNAQYVEELKYFPDSTYKDQVDASSGAMTVLGMGKVRVGVLRSRGEVSRPPGGKRNDVAALLVQARRRLGSRGKVLAH